MAGDSTFTVPNPYDTQHVDAPSAVYTLDDDNIRIQDFPTYRWQRQVQRYRKYWRWFSGEELAKVQTTDKNGEPVYHYPLRLNAVRDFSEKLAAVVVGEEPHDSPYPLMRSMVFPKNYLMDEAPPEDELKKAKFLQNFINEVWQSSHGRALQSENAILSQFLGGCVFQVKWQPWRTDKLVPITIEKVLPDFFLPIWDEEDYWWLLEAFVVYRVPAATARAKYGIDVENNSAGYVTYVEHWTRTTYSIYIDNEPLVADFEGTTITYKNLENPFGFVPLVYIPRVRHGTFEGPALVDDIEGVVVELNSRMADVGDAIHNNTNPRRYMKNVKSEVREVWIDDATPVYDLGGADTLSKHEPDIKTEAPPNFSDTINNHNEKLWQFLQRFGGVGPINYGEDEGSQRSALTLAFRMWPTTSKAKTQRTFWNTGLNVIAKMLMIILEKKQHHPLLADLLSKARITLEKNFHRNFEVHQKFLPQIPRDREQLVDEIVIRYQAGLISLKKALEDLGDVQNIEEEEQAIKEMLEFKAKLNMKLTTESPAEKPQNMTGIASTETKKQPVAETVVGDD